jgi:hypothetical protein
VIASVLPFNARVRGSRAFPGLTGTPVDVADDRASQILAAASLRLSSDGAALYVVAPNLLSRSDSILRKLGQLGLGLDAAFALPAGTFAPYTNLAAYRRPPGGLRYDVCCATEQGQPHKRADS